MRNTLIVCKLIALLICFGFASDARAQGKMVKVDGSSTVFPISEAMAEEFQKDYHDIKVTVGVSGPGGGFKGCVRGEIDISDASRTILEKEVARARKNAIDYTEISIALGAPTIMVHPKSEWVAKLT